LTKSFGLYTIPRLTTTVSPASPEKFYLSEEFKYVFAHCDSSSVLQVIRDNWDLYSKWMEESSSGKDTSTLKASKENVRASIGSMTVKCRRGTSVLRDTVLPGLDREMDENPCVRGLLIKDPQKPQSRILRRFGVIVDRGLKYYLRCLQAIQGSNASKHTIAHIYEKIQSEYDNNEQLIW